MISFSPVQGLVFVLELHEESGDVVLHLRDPLDQHVEGRIQLFLLTLQ